MGVMGAMKGPFLDRFTGDLVLLDQFEHQFWSLGQLPGQVLSGGWPQGFIDRFGRFPQPCIDQPDVATRATLTDAVGLQQADINPGLRQMQRG